MALAKVRRVPGAWSLSQVLRQEPLRIKGTGRLMQDLPFTELQFPLSWEGAQSATHSSLPSGLMEM